MKNLINLLTGSDAVSLIMIVGLILAFIGCVAYPICLLIAVVLAFFAPIVLAVNTLIE